MKSLTGPTRQTWWCSPTGPAPTSRPASSSQPARLTSPGSPLMINFVKLNLAPGLMVASRLTWDYKMKMAAICPPMFQTGSGPLWVSIVSRCSPDSRLEPFVVLNVGYFYIYAYYCRLTLYYLPTVYRLRPHRAHHPSSSVPTPSTTHSHDTHLMIPT